MCEYLTFIEDTVDISYEHLEAAKLDKYIDKKTGDINATRVEQDKLSPFEVYQVSLVSGFIGVRDELRKLHDGEEILPLGLQSKDTDGDVDSVLRDILSELDINPRKKKDVSVRSQVISLDTSDPRKRREIMKLISKIKELSEEDE